MDPNVANFFPKDETWEWAFKGSGSYLFPGNILAAAFFSRNSGTAVRANRTVHDRPDAAESLTLLMEPTGSQRLPSINLLNLRAEKRVKLRKTEAAFQLDLFNATNSNVTSSVIARSGVDLRQHPVHPPSADRAGRGDVYVLSSAQHGI